MTVVSFDQAVEYYDNTRGYPSGVAEAICDVILQHTHADTNTKFLELGIGTGLIAHPFVNAGCNYVGVDVSSKMMAQIHQKLSSNAHFLALQADITKPLPFSAHTFDVILAARVLHVLDQWQLALVEAKRVLCKSGYLLIGRDENLPSNFDPVKMVHAQWDEILADLGVAPMTIRPGMWLKDETIADFLRELGAEVEIVDLLTYDSAPITLRIMAARHEQRMYSRDWELSEVVNREAVQRLNAWLETKGATADQQVTTSAVFRAIITRWP